MPSKSSQWLSDNFDAVSQRFPDEWVAADENGVVLHGVDAGVIYNDLSSVAQKAGKSVGDYTVMHIPGAGIQ